LGFSAILVRNASAARWYQPNRATATAVCPSTGVRTGFNSRIFEARTIFGASEEIRMQMKTRRFESEMPQIFEVRTSPELLQIKNVIELSVLHLKETSEALKNLHERAKLRMDR
jgi:hypothetical protein